MTEIRLDAPSNFKVVRTDDGRLHCEGAFCRDGVLEYRQPDGTVIRELRRPESNADPKTIESFKLLPLVVEHPPIGLLNSRNYKNFAVGMTDSSARYDSSEGVIKGLVSFFDAKAIAHIDSKEKEELSAGYTCDIKAERGVWNGQEYDREQINVRANHLALTSKGRAGDDVRLRLDSDKGIGQIISEDIKKRMATIRCDGVEYSDIPEAFASVAGSRFRELDELKPRFDSFQEKLELLTQQLKAVEQEKEASQSRIDSLETIVNSADSALADFGFYRSDSGQYIRVDGGKAKQKQLPFPPESEDETEESWETKDEETMEDEEMEPVHKSSKKGKKTIKADSEDNEIRQDSVPDLLAAWKEADELIQCFSTSRFDSSFSVSDVKRTVLAEIEPDLDLSSRSDAFVEGVFSRVKETFDSSKSDPDPEEGGDESGQEEKVDYIKRLDSALKTGSKYSDGNGLTEGDKRRIDACKKPLTMSKSQVGMSK